MLNDQFSTVSDEGRATPNVGEVGLCCQAYCRDVHEGDEPPFPENPVRQHLAAGLVRLK